MNIHVVIAALFDLQLY